MEKGIVVIIASFDNADAIEGTYITMLIWPKE